MLWWPSEQIKGRAAQGLFFLSSSPVLRRESRHRRGLSLFVSVLYEHTSTPTHARTHTHAHTGTLTLRFTLTLPLSIISPDLQVTDKAYNIRSKPPEHSLSSLTFSVPLLPYLSSALPLFPHTNYFLFHRLPICFFYLSSPVRDQRTAYQRRDHRGICRIAFGYPALEVSDN